MLAKNCKMGKAWWMPICMIYVDTFHFAHTTSCKKDTCHYEEGKGLPDEVIQLFITLIFKSIFYSDVELLNNWIAAPWRARNDMFIRMTSIRHPALDAGSINM